MGFGTSCRAHEHCMNIGATVEQHLYSFELPVSGSFRARFGLLGAATSRGHYPSDSTRLRTQDCQHLHFLHIGDCPGSAIDIFHLKHPIDNRCRFDRLYKTHWDRRSQTSLKPHLLLLSNNRLLPARSSNSSKIEQRPSRNIVREIGN